jgi:hypothetical protein
MSPEPSDLPIPAPKDWQVFERHMRDLLEADWGPPVEMNGRTGQPQCGVDIYGRPKGADGYHGVQCKQKDGLCGGTVTDKELKAEVKKAKKFRPKIKHFILAISSTTPLPRYRPDIEGGSHEKQRLRNEAGITSGNRNGSGLSAQARTIR